MKEEQLEVVVAFLCGSDVFAVLPTGFRRSLLCMPAFYFRVAIGETEEKPIVVVVTPLTAIMVTYLIYTNVIHTLLVCTSPSIV